MKVSGFTIVRNAIKYDYPVIESIQSLLPLVDELIVLVGNSDDETFELISSIQNQKLKIYQSVWNDELREGGQVLALETDKCKKLVSDDSDWLFYLQADEVLHEKDYEKIRLELNAWKDDKRVEGILLKYKHFYGSYDFVGDFRRWYKHEIRIIRNDSAIKSYRDAQGFRINGRKLHVKKCDATVYHYGWVKHPKFQQAKQESFHRMWHDDKWIKENVLSNDQFDYSKIDSLKKFEGIHPSTMHERIKKSNWKFDFDPSLKKFSFKNRLLYFVESKTGYRPGEYKNYKII